MLYQFSFFDLWPYIIIALVFIYCYIYEVEKSSFVIYITLLLFCSLRYDVGWDYTAYVSEIENGFSELVDSRYEPLSKLILFISILFNFYPITFVIFAYLTLVLIKKSIDEFSANPTISWLVFYSMPLFFFASLSTLRQSLATVIILFSFKYLYKKNYLYFVASIVVASLFHVSALMGLLLLPLMLIPINKYVNYLLFFLSFLISPIIKNFVTTYLLEFSFLSRVSEFYIDSDTASTTTLQYLYYAVNLFNLIFYDKLVGENEINKKIITISTFGVVIFNVLAFEPISASRISAFFLLFWIYLFPYYGIILSEKLKKIFELLLIVVLIALSFYYLKMYIDNYENNVQEKVSFLPYKFWFNNL